MSPHLNIKNKRPINMLQLTHKHIINTTITHTDTLMNAISVCAAAHERSGLRKKNTRTVRPTADCGTRGEKSVKELISNGAGDSPACGSTSEGASHYDTNNMISDSSADTSSNDRGSVGVDGAINTTNTSGATNDGGAANNDDVVNSKGAHTNARSKR